ncbi:hypothetical protein LG301_01975 [Vreelandella venusta]|uniref:hypothetical protein n=1 Tax=Vreelandella venusta TaxID=44935 RepID=UPI00384F9398
MNVSTTMDGLYVIKARFDYLAKQLEQAGYQQAAEELNRESHRFGCQLTQLDSVFGDYRADIASAQESEGQASRSAKAPRASQFCHGVMLR